jgi:hypothetical protein
MSHPVACIYKGYLYWAHEFPKGIPKNSVPLFAEYPAQEPLTEDEIDAAIGHETLDYRRGFNNGAKHAEITHKIK